MKNTMKAVVNYAREPDCVELREVPIPEYGDNEVLLRVDAVGICGSELHQWKATHSWPVNYPCALGHEFGGVIIEKGASVSHFECGDRVVSETAAVIDPFSSYSRQGLYNLDPSRLGFGYGVDGAMAEYVAVPERCLHDIPDELPIERAALTEPCCVAYNAVCMQTLIRPGDHVVILGPGPIGLFCALMAKLAGAGCLIVAGLPSDAKRLAVAREIGADIALDGGLHEYVKEMGDGMGVDAVIDATGVSATLKTSLEIVRPAGQITKVGWGPQPMDFSLDPAVQKAVTIRGSFSHNWPIWERVIRLQATGQLDIGPLISRIAPLEEWHSCFTRMHEADYVKAVLLPQK